MSNCGCGVEETERLEKKTLVILLAINAFMFVAEVALGWYAQSMGLIADALDMLADAMVYGLSLYVVGQSIMQQKKAAKVSGYLQIILGVGVLIEVVRRTIMGSEPQSTLIIVVGAIALLANVICLRLIAKHRQGGVHMRAAWIFSTNDVIANFGVMFSGVLVAIVGSRYPDLMIGTLISVVVIRGGIKIIKEANEVQVAEHCA